MKLNPKYTIAWILWILGFAVLEYMAIKNKKEGDTLSEHVWKVIGTDNKKKKTAAMWTARVVLGVGFAWLVPHFFTGWNF